MTEDPVVEEMRRYRREHAARHNHDLAEICKALRDREAQSQRKVIDRGPRRLPVKTG